MRLAVRLTFAASLAVLAACSTAPTPPPPEPTPTVTVPPSAGVYKIGQPYQVDNVSITRANSPIMTRPGSPPGMARPFTAAPPPMVKSMTAIN